MTFKAVVLAWFCLATVVEIVQSSCAQPITMMSTTRSRSSDNQFQTPVLSVGHAEAVNTRANRLTSEFVWDVTYPCLTSDLLERRLTAQMRSRRTDCQLRTLSIVLIEFKRCLTSLAALNRQLSLTRL